MNNDLISRAALLEAVQKDFEGVCVYDVSPSEAILDIERIANSIPTVDAEPVKHGKWVSVKDKLPEKQLRVIVCNGHGVVTAGWRSYNKDKNGVELWTVGDEPHHANDIVFWMPLPEPPKEG